MRPVTKYYEQKGRLYGRDCWCVYYSPNGWETREILLQWIDEHSVGVAVVCLSLVAFWREDDALACYLAFR